MSLELNMCMFISCLTKSCDVTSKSQLQFTIHTSELLENKSELTTLPVSWLLDELCCLTLIQPDDSPARSEVYTVISEGGFTLIYFQWMSEMIASSDRHSECKCFLFGSWYVTKLGPCCLPELCLTAPAAATELMSRSNYNNWLPVVLKHLFVSEPHVSPSSAALTDWKPQV